MSGGRTTLSTTSKKAKKKHLRTAPSTNRTSSAEKYLTPNPTGMGSPLVLVWDGKGKLLLDLMQTQTNFYGFALEKFTYEFKEKEEDKCTITLSSTSVDLLNNLRLFKGQKLLVSWGYMDGNLRPPLNVVVVDTKEKYDVKGFGLTIICSDNLSFFSRGKTTLVVKLESSVQAITDLLTPNYKEVDNNIETLKGYMVDGWIGTRHWQYSKGYAYTTGPARSTGRFPQPTDQDRANYLAELQDYYSRTKQMGYAPNSGYDRIPTHPFNDEKIKGIFSQIGESIYDIPYAEAVGIIPSSNTLIQNAPFVNINGAITGIPAGPTSDDMPPAPETFPQISPREMEALAKVSKDLHGYNISVTGKNAQSLSQNCLDKVAPYPMQVTGHDGKVITYNKNRAIAGPAIREYTFKGETGGLLEFTFDTNSQYSDDSNVLRQFAIDPKTGALTQKDFINNQKKVEDVENNTESKRISFTHYVEKFIDEVAVTTPEDLWMVPYMKQFKNHSAIDKATSNQVLIAQGGNLNTSAGTQKIPRGWAQEHMPAMDGTAINTTIEANVTPHLNETKEAMENQLKNLKRGEQEKVKAHATILGDPQITSGVKVAFKGLASHRNGSYFLTGCIHDIEPNSGFTTKFEMYYVGDISQSVNTVESTHTKEDIEKRAKEIKDKKLKIHSNYAQVAERGYFLKTDFKKDTWELAAEKLDKDWNVKMPGVFYSLKFTQPDGSFGYYVIKIPITTSGKTQDALKAFGFDAIYDMVGCHDIMWVRRNIQLNRIEKIGEDGQYTPFNEGFFPDPAPNAP